MASHRQKTGIANLLTVLPGGKGASAAGVSEGELLLASEPLPAAHHLHPRLNDYAPPRYMELTQNELDVYEELITTHADANIHRPSDAPLFARLAREICTVLKLEKFLDTYGNFYSSVSAVTGIETEKVRPEVQLLPQARVRENKYYEMLGLTPVFRAKLVRKADASKRDRATANPSRWLPTG